MITLPEDEIVVHDYVHYSQNVAGNGSGAKTIINAILKYFKTHDVDFDCIIGVGNSGMALGSILSYLMDKPFWHMRNSDVNRNTQKNCLSLRKHVYCNQPAATLENTKCLFIDDLIETGKTLARAIKCLEMKGARLRYVAVDNIASYSMDADLNRKLIETNVIRILP